MPRRARWLAQDDAQGLVEYAVILALTSLGMILALMLLRDSIGSPVQGSSQQLDGLTAGGPSSGSPAGGVATPGDGPAGGSSGTGGAGRPAQGNGQGNSGRGNGNGGSNGDWDDRQDR